jgi:DNA modification methylase
VKAWKILQGDLLGQMEWMANASVQCCVTSPPYFGLRDYGHDGQIGLEATPPEYVSTMVDVFREVRRVLKPDGTLWLNLGDSYAGSGKGGNPSTSPHQKQKSNLGSVQGIQHRKTPSFDGIKPKDLIGIPWRVAFALQADGWYLRQDIIWHKPNPMPESIKDRCTKAHEYIFLFSKSPKYYFDNEAMKEDVLNAGKTVKLGAKSFAKRQADGAGVNPSGNGNTDVYDVPAFRNRRSVWTVATRPYKGAHFATYPPALITPCVLAGSRVGDVVFDPFAGSGTTGAVAVTHGRKAIMCELNQEYVGLIESRMAQVEQEAER